MIEVADERAPFCVRCGVGLVRGQAIGLVELDIGGYGLTCPGCTQPGEEIGTVFRHASQTQS